MLSADNPIAATFDDLDSVIQAFNKSAIFSLDKIVSYLLYPLFQGSQESIETLNITLPYCVYPVPEATDSTIAGGVCIEYPGELMAQLTGFF